MTPFYQKIYPSLTWQYPGKMGDYIFLTFDDGPIPEVTPWVLDILKEYQVKATFFCVGENVLKYPHIFKNILANGHAVGNHTQNHLKGWKTGLFKYVKNVQQCSEHIESKLFRPPYGKISRSQLMALKKLGYNIIMWDTLTRDFDTVLSPEKCLQNALKARSGSIVVFHDSKKAWDRLAYALPLFLEHYTNRGFKFLPLNP